VVHLRDPKIVDESRQAMANHINRRRAFAERVLLEFEGKGSSSGWPVIPFPGMRSFTAKEATIFFGREQDKVRIREKLALEHCAFVLGGSGAGKSSLVRASLIPDIIAGSPLNDRWGAWYVLTLTPGRDPFENLARALLSDIFGIRQSPSSHCENEKPTTSTAIRDSAVKESLFRLSKNLRDEELSSDASAYQLERRLTERLRRRYRHDGEGLAEFLYKEVDHFHANFVQDKVLDSRS
jgi:hypothetical protein